MLANKKTAYVIDSSANLIPDQNWSDVYLLPLNIVSQNGTEIHDYKDLIDLDSQAVTKKIIEGVNLKTSQPAIGKMITLLEELLTKYEQVFVFTISSGISSTYSSWINAINSSEFKNVYVIDSQTIGYGIVHLLQNTKKLVESNLNSEVVYELAKKQSENIWGMLIVNNIDQLEKGGRIASWKAKIVKTLKLAIVISFKKTLDLHSKELNLASAIKKSVSNIKKQLGLTRANLSKAVVMSSFVDEKKTLELKEIVSKEFNGVEVEIEPFPPAILVHVGIDALGIYAIKK